MYFDDMPVGFRYETARRTVSLEEIKAFAAEWDPQPFHLDEEAAKASPYGQLISSGFQTVLIAFRLSLEANTWAESSMGGPGLDELRWLKPVYPGDTLRVEAEVVAAKPSSSKPDRGFVEIQNTVFNQDDVKVASYRAKHILRRRQAE